MYLRTRGVVFFVLLSVGVGCNFVYAMESGGFGNSKKLSTDGAVVEAFVLLQFKDGMCAVSENVLHTYPELALYCKEVRLAQYKFVGPVLEACCLLPRASTREGEGVCEQDAQVEALIQSTVEQVWNKFVLEAAQTEDDERIWFFGYYTDFYENLLKWLRGTVVPVHPALITIFERLNVLLMHACDE